MGLYVLWPQRPARERPAVVPAAITG
jgi:hypothetical protein